MKTDSIKEWREWATFIFTVLTLVAAPLGLIVLKNQRLEIEASADAKFQTKSDASVYQSLTNAKLDKITDAAESTRQDIAVIKSQLSNLNNRSRP